MKKQYKLHIGTSGWHYSHWRGVFYPASLRINNFLKFYVEYFDTAEINNTFYRLPEDGTVIEWRDTVPENFVFSMKASRYITHMKKLKEPENTLPRFLEKAELMGSKLGPVLFQLPPHWHFDLERLSNFLRTLPKRLRCAFEFRDPSWFGEEAAQMLIENKTAFCIYDFAGRQLPHTVTSDFIYIRLHGPNGAYQGQYSDQDLSRWSDEITQWLDNNKEVFCYFDNDEAGYAVQDALRLKSLLSNR